MKKQYYKRNQLCMMLGIDGNTIKRYEEEYEEKVEKNELGEIEYVSFSNLLSEVLNRIKSELKKKTNYTGEEIKELFGCSLMSGMARSHKTNTLVLISDQQENKNNSYHDYWENDILYYTGMGKCGDQKLNGTQNETLLYSDENGITVFLFLKDYDKELQRSEYIYRGIVKLGATPYLGKETGEDGVLRNVWKFPLEIIEEAELDLLRKKRIEEYITTIQKKMSQQLDSKTLYIKAKAAGQERLRSNNVQRKGKNPYRRDGYIAEYAVRRANGICECCSQSAPFKVNNIPFLESHHICWLSKGGKDCVENVAGVCPNCHRKLHLLNQSDDIIVVKKNVVSDEDRMSKEREVNRDKVK